MLGPLINGAAIVGGSLIGAGAGNRIPDRVKTALPLTFGLSALCIGISLIAKLSSLPPVILAALVGALTGELLRLEDGLGACSLRVRASLSRFLPGATVGDNASFVERYVAMLVLFSASALGIFGSIDEGLGNGCSMLVTKAILDFFTAIIFASSLGLPLVFVAVPQMLIQTALFFSADLLAPFMDAAARGNFSAAGGIIMLATGFRICGMKNFPIANLLPALLFVVPFTELWHAFF